VADNQGLLKLKRLQECVEKLRLVLDRYNPLVVSFAETVSWPVEHNHTKLPGNFIDQLIREIEMGTGIAMKEDNRAPRSLRNKMQPHPVNRDKVACYRLRIRPGNLYFLCHRWFAALQTIIHAVLTL
jgi:hypothetical protein